MLIRCQGRSLLPGALMLGLMRSDHWSQTVVALLLLAANIDAPFRSAQGRTLLYGTGGQVATSAVGRARGLAPVGGVGGYRAVVGLGKGAPGEAKPGARSATPPHFLPSPAGPLACRPADRPVVRPYSPLRC